MNKVLAIALIAAAASGCSSNAKKAREANPAPCPNVLVLKDASRFIDFDGDQTIENVAYTGEIVDVSTVCRYYGDKPIEAEISLDFAFGKGPKGEEFDKVFKYFVAVTRTNSEVIAKTEFFVPAEFEDDNNVTTLRVDVDRITIPRVDENTSGTNFELVVGFAVTPRQAIYNRSGKSLKFPDIK